MNLDDDIRTPRGRRRAADHMGPLVGWRRPPLILAPDPDGYGMGYLGGDKGHGYLSGGRSGSVEIFVWMGWYEYTFGETPQFGFKITNTAPLTSVSMKLIYSLDPYAVAPAGVTYGAFPSDSVWSDTGWNVRPAANGHYDFVAGLTWEATVTCASLPAGSRNVTITWPTTINLNTSRKLSITLGGVPTYAPSDSLPSSTEIPGAAWNIIADPTALPYNLVGVGTERSNVV